MLRVHREGLLRYPTGERIERQGLVPGAPNHGDPRLVSALSQRLSPTTRRIEGISRGQASIGPAGSASAAAAERVEEVEEVEDVHDRVAVVVGLDAAGARAGRGLVLAGSERVDEVQEIEDVDLGVAVHV